MFIERRKQERLQESAARRRDWNERYGHRATTGRGTEISDPTSDLSSLPAGGARPSEYGSNRPVDDPMHARNRSGATASVVVKMSSAPSSRGGATSAKNTSINADTEDVAPQPRRGLRKLFGGGNKKDASGAKKDDDVSSNKKKDKQSEKAATGADPVYSVSDGILIIFLHSVCIVPFSSILSFLLMRNKGPQIFISLRFVRKLIHFSNEKIS